MNMLFFFFYLEFVRVFKHLPTCHENLKTMKLQHSNSSNKLRRHSNNISDETLKSLSSFDVKNMVPINTHVRTVTESNQQVIGTDV